MSDSLGIYISVPFCKAKCTFCNFASDTFAPARMDGYVERVAAELRGAGGFAEPHSLRMPADVDSIYFGGGTPSLLRPDHFEAIFRALREVLEITPDAEITVECAPGQIATETINAMLRAGVNRISMGVQSFSDAETAAVGRTHSRAECLAEIARLRACGMTNLGIDLICGLPHQTRASWRETLQTAIAADVDHVSVYMLEVDDESRLGRELIGNGTRYGAGLVPQDDAVTEMYVEACDTLNAAGIVQYEISNFARVGMQSRHNRKYWARDPYLGVGLDAHSMLYNRRGDATRFANADDFDEYMASGEGPVSLDTVEREEAFEEEVMLGLRLVEGISLTRMRSAYARDVVADFEARARELQRDGLMTVEADRMSLTSRGRVVSSSVFGELLAVGV